MHKRNNHIDIIKGLAIFLVIWGHIVQDTAGNVDVYFDNIIFKVIYSFHMPLFMLVSGYVYNYNFESKTIKQVLAKRITNIVHAIIGGTIISFYVAQIIEGLYQRNILLIFSSNWLSKFGYIWFLWSILSSSILVGIVFKNKYKPHFQIILAVVAAPMVYLFPNGDLNAYMYPYFLAGFLFSKYRSFMPVIFNKLKFSSLILFPVMITAFESKHYIYTSGILPFSSQYGFYNQINIDLFRYLIGFAGSIALISLVELIIKFPQLTKPFDQIAIWGRYSLHIYIYQRIFVENIFAVTFKYISVKLESNPLMAQLSLYNYIYTPLIALIFIMTIMFFIKLLERYDLNKLIIGR